MDTLKCNLYGNGVNVNKDGKKMSSLEHHLQKASPLENSSLYKTMTKESLSFKKAVNYWLKKRGASNEIIKNFNDNKNLALRGDIFEAGM